MEEQEFEEQEVDYKDLTNLTIILEYPDGTNYTFDVSTVSGTVVNCTETPSTNELINEENPIIDGCENITYESDIDNEANEQIPEVTCKSIAIEDESNDGNNGKKRKRQSVNSESQDRKTRRASGLPYVSVTGKPVPGKTFKPVTKCCDNKCHFKFPVSVQEKIFHNFYNLADYNAQSVFVFYHIRVKSVARHYRSRRIKKKNKTRQYFLPNDNDDDEVVCKHFFRSLLQISDGRIDRLLKGSDPPIDKRGRGTAANKTSDEKVQQVCRFIPKLQFESSVDATGKDVETAILNGALNIRAIYREYCDHTTDIVSERTFRNILRRNLIWKYKDSEDVIKPSHIENEKHDEDLVVPDEVAPTQDYKEVLPVAEVEESEPGEDSADNEEESDQQCEEIIFLTGTKRGRKADKWNKNERKIKRNYGLTYTNTSGKVVPGKSFSIITKCCQLKCYRRFPDELQTQIFQGFYAIGSFDGQNAFIFKQVQVVPVARHYKSQNIKQKNRTRKYCLHDMKGKEVFVCKTFFRTVLAISDGRIDRVLKSKDPKSVQPATDPPKDQRGRHTPPNKTPDDKVEEVCEAINSFPTRQELDLGNVNDKKMNVRLMYKHYCDRSSAPVSQTVFRNIFNARYVN